MREDLIRSIGPNGKGEKDAERRWRAMRFLEWAEKTHPATVNRLRQAYEKSKEGGEE
tara:strand:+ start:1528 stop:1698 length:171 start_codon:yes stop_codon:yes gene_type:complete